MLDPERWAEAERIFARAWEIDPGERADFVMRECADEELRKEVTALLDHAGDELRTAHRAIQSMAGSIVASAANSLDPPDHDPLVGTWLGPYRIEGLLGRGGMGAVYRAVREDEQFHKQVAIKVVPRVLAGPDAVARFRSERQILANLEHPGIARLLDGGTSQGIPYIVMEYVEGVPITEYVRAQAMSIPNRLRLMQSVCAAVLYAHRNLVIHRDLKPANILVNSDGAVKLLDFGIAKLVDPTRTEPALTSRMMLMTPEYASPEQLQGGAVTTASDVYSLGVVLYEVLTGERPHRITSSNLEVVERAIRETGPRKPSSVASLPARVRRRLAGDLDNIVLMALHTDPARRYGSVEQLAEDIRRHLLGLPVQARPDTLLYRSTRFLGRHRSVVAAGFLVVTSLVTGTVVAGREARAARERFDQLREFARTVLVDLHGQLSDIPGATKARQALIADVDDYLKRVAAQHAGDDTALADEFATTYLRLGEMQGSTPEAISSFTKGRQLIERKGGGFSSTDAWLRARAGSALLDLGRIQEGVENLNAAVSLANGLSPKPAWNSEAELVKAFADRRLAMLYRVQDRLQDSGEHAQKAIAVAEELLRRGYRTREVYEVLSGARNALAAVWRRQGHWQQSIEMYQRVLAETEERARAEPESAGLERELARSHLLLSDMLTRLPNFDENEVRLHVRSAIAIAERLAANDPWDKTLQTELGQCLADGAEDLPESHWKEAIGYQRRALPIFESLLKSEPESGVLRLYKALTEADVGKSLARSGSNRESIGWLRRGLADVKNLAEGDPKNTLYRLESIKIERWLVEGLARTGEPRESLALAQDGIDRALLVAGDVGATPESWRELPRAYAAMAAACRVLGRSGESRKWYRIATAQWDKMRARGVYFPDSEQEIAEARTGAGIASSPGTPTREKE